MTQETTYDIPSPPRWQQLVLILLYTAGFAVVASSLLTIWGFPLDDSYLYQTVARALAHGSSGFYPGRAGAGATSFLWVCIQSLNFVTGGHISPVLFNLVLSWILLLCIGQLLLLLATRDGLSTPARWILAASPAFCGNFLWLGLIGMEHLLLIVLALASICLWFRQEEEPGSRSSLLVGLMVGLLVITRPEGAPLGPLLALAIRRAHRSVREAASMLAVWAVFVAGFFGINLYTSHTLMPVTMQGRLWLWFRFQGGPHSLRAIKSFFLSWLAHLPRIFSSVFGTQQISAEGADRLYTILACAIFVLAVIGLIAWLRKLSARFGMLLALAGVQFFMYLALFPVLGHGGRYQSFLLLLIFPAVFSGLYSLLQPLLASARASWPQRCLILAVLAGGVFSLAGWRSIAIDGITHIDETHGAMARWIATHLPQNARVGAFDSGRISYTLPQSVTDLGGLADSGYLPYLMDDDIPEYLAKYHIQYVVQPVIDDDEMLDLDESEVKLQQLAQFCSPFGMWLRGFNYTGHAWQCQRLYKLTYVDSAAN
ncbi:hypothetical protein [Silvibacterium acidisoli]|uniref:hypothetical protein n=1 Tax=Acidobacteriaceae bacterium ZG23-2 TaxID=2883246 RepID=UPI00406C9C2E